MEALPRTETLPAIRVTPAGMVSSERAVPVEMPVAFSFFGIGYAVMMASPADLHDFAVGFARSERLIEQAGDVVEVEIAPVETGILLKVELAPERRPLLFDRVRHRVGETSCGLCGIENLEQALRPLPRVGPPVRTTPAALFAALKALRAHQPANAETGALHAAALFDAEGRAVAVREDVGRHNAFDKLIGHCLRDGIDVGQGFALLTSRCSYELVEKAALAGISLLLTVSAPTSLAVDRALEAGITLVALARSDAMLAMTDPYDIFGGL